MEASQISTIKMTLTFTGKHVEIQCPGFFSESTDSRYCLTPTKDRLEVKLQTMTTDGTRQETYPNVWFKLEVKGEAVCELSQVSGVNTFTKTLNCPCTT